MIDKLYAVDAPHFYAGIIINDEIIIDAAPILKWSVGKKWEWFKSYTIKKGWKIINV